MREEELLCAKCKLPSDRKLYCLKCCNKTSQASKVFGTWPIDCFKRLTEEQQIEFWRGSGNSQQSIMGALTKIVTDSNVKEQSDMKRGKYLPLSVYEKEGYDVNRIQLWCADKEEHPILGTCYRVDIREIAYGDIWRKVQQELVELKIVGRAQKRKADKREETKKKKRE